jgi:putative oxidoreductase
MPMNLFATERGSTWGLVPLRAVVGFTFVMHGGLKLFTMGIAGTTAMMAQMGVPFPQVNAVMVTGIEILGGLAIVLGLFTRVAGALLACDMLGVILIVKLRSGFFAPRGLELELALLGACLTLALMGPGGVSIDRTRRRGLSL